MPLIYDPQSTRIHMQGDGWVVTTLADSADTGSAVLVVRRWSLQPAARTPPVPHEPGEGMLYVVRGSGFALLGEKCFELEAESMLWLEPGDTCVLLAGDDGLEILQGCAS